MEELPIPALLIIPYNGFASVSKLEAIVSAAMVTDSSLETSIVSIIKRSDHLGSFEVKSPTASSPRFSSLEPKIKNVSG